MKVKDLMKEWVTVKPDTKVSELAKILDQHLTGSALVVDGNVPVGVVTERDILRKIVTNGKSPREIEVRRIMSSPVITIDAREDLTTASDLMDNKRIRRLAVVDNGKVIGKITANIISRNFRYLWGRHIADYAHYEEHR